MTTFPPESSWRGVRFLDDDILQVRPARELRADERLNAQLTVAERCPDARLILEMLGLL